MTYKLIYLARRNPTVAREDWPRTWRSHAIFASQFPVLEAKIDYMRYCNRVDAPTLDGRPVELPGLSTAHDGVAIAASESLEGINGTGFNDADRAKIDQDELRVFDMLTPNFTYYCTEAVLRDGALGEAAVFSFLARKPDASHEEFDARWCGEHRQAALEAINALGTITRYVNNRPVHEPRPLFPFDGIAEAWFPSAEDAVRAFTGSELDPLRRDLAQFCDFSRSVIMLTSVCHRWPKS